jgi:hypothetical protein
MTDTSPEAVERFDINWRDYRKDIDANGDYVTYEDYAALSKQLTAAKTTLDTFKASHQINLALRKAAEEHITTAHAAGKAEGLRAAAKRYRDGGTIENCELDAALAFIHADTPAAKAVVEDTDLQPRVNPWMQACFGPKISADRLERGDRFLEEALELLQSGNYPQERVAALSSYVFGRKVGDPSQEVGGVMITLAAYCLAHGLNMHESGELELARIWTKVEKIRAKQAAKPTGSALPIPPIAGGQHD